MRRTRIACVGSGFIAGRHLAALSGFDDVEIVAVADAVPERAVAIAARYGARPHGDALDLLGSEELDAVWFCVPPFAHGALEEAAVARRLPFFVEKPLAADLATAERVAGKVARAGLLTAVGYHWRQLSSVRRAAELLRDRPPHLVTGLWLDKTPAPPWWSSRAASGGQVLEQTTHIFDLARLLVGEVDGVTALERPVPPGATSDVPSAATALLSFATGAVGAISSARVLTWRHGAGLQLVADGCVVELCERSLTEHELRVTGGSGEEEVVRSEEDPIAREDREFLDVLAGRAPSVSVPYAEALRTHALAWAADLSARERRSVRLAADGAVGPAVENAR
jgi:myo-inositol 2-dehydrogenase / D-chiro-inositol 1-dehydrogenase